jgi:hypothetical protein
MKLNLSKKSHDTVPLKVRIPQIFCCSFLWVQLLPPAGKYGEHVGTFLSERSNSKTVGGGEPLSLCQLRWGDLNKIREAILDVSAEVERSK